jgi:hypothetical protein
MLDEEKSKLNPMPPAPVFLGQAFRKAPPSAVSSPPQSKQTGADSPAYVANGLVWDELDSTPASFQWGQFFIGLVAPLFIAWLTIILGITPVSLSLGIPPASLSLWLLAYVGAIFGLLASGKKAPGIGVILSPVFAILLFFLTVFLLTM